MSQVKNDKFEKLNDSEKELWKLRHSCEHVLTQAMVNLYGKDRIIAAMGPATNEGFYFDFDIGDGFKINEENFSKIRKEILKIIRKNLPFKREELTIKKAREIFKNNPYKQQWLDEIEERSEKATVYWTGKEFVDLCSGPHVKSTGEIKAFKLLSIAGAYWRGDEKNKMLNRIYGTAFFSKEELDKYLWQISEAKKRDHRKLGQELDLFSSNELTGSGLILWHPKLAIVRNIVEQFWRNEHYKHGYKLVFSPHIATMDMFVKSRHYNKYINAMFPVMMHQYIEGESRADYKTDEQLKPMNCPNHIQIYKNKLHSYKDLPFRMGELGAVYRYERSGQLHGMTRVRGFTQDDSHIFCRPSQVIDEVRGVLKLTKLIYKAFGFKNYKAYLSTKPENHLGSNKMWHFAEESLKKALNLEKIEYEIEEGEGAFYGPKIDSKIKDSMGREWQLGTIQFDFNMPDKAESTKEDLEEFWAMKTFKDKFKTKDRLKKYLKKMGRGFNVQYTNNKGKRKQAVMIHRTILGSMERFFGVLIEHYNGAFPVWLSPIQVAVVPISTDQDDYAKKITKSLEKELVRVENFNENESMQKRIRKAEKQKIPYILVVGKKEQKKNLVSVRQRGEKALNKMSVDSFLDEIRKKIDSKSL